MPSKDSTIRLLLRSGAFQSGIRRLTSQVSAAGQRMGRAISGPMTAGLGAAKKSLAGFGGEIKGHIKTAATLGGALTVGTFIKDAVSLESKMKDLSFTIGIMTGKAMHWRDIQTKIQRVADDTSNKTEDVAAAFKTVLDATKDPEFAFETLKTMGVHATGTTEDIRNVASVVQMLRRQVGVTKDEVPGLLASITELSKQGGPSFEDLARVGDKVAAVMQQAGLQGADSFKKMIGIMNAADSTMAGVDKQVVGLQMSLQKLTEESVLKRIAKDIRIPAKDLLGVQNSFDALKKILATGEKGILRLGQEFIGPEADKMAEVFSAPFKTAYREAKKEGAIEKKAVEIGLKALDDSFEKWSTTSLTHADISAQAAKRQEDTDRQFSAAIDKMKQAFTKPEMMSAIDQLAEQLPKVADGFVKVLDFIMEHPLLSAAGFVGGKAALAGGAAALGAGAKGLIGAGATKVAATGAAMKAGTAITAAGVTTAATTVALGGAVGAGIGYGAFKLGVEPGLKEGFNTLDRAANTLSDATSALVAGDIETKSKALAEVKSQLKEVREGPTDIEHWVGNMSNFFADVKTAGEQYRDKEKKLLEAQTQLEKSIRRMNASMTSVAEVADAAGEGLGKVKTGAANPAIRNPKTNLNKEPGSAGKRG